MRLQCKRKCGMNGIDYMADKGVKQIAELDLTFLKMQQLRECEFSKTAALVRDSAYVNKRRLRKQTRRLS